MNLIDFWAQTYKTRSWITSWLHMHCLFPFNDLIESMDQGYCMDARHTFRFASCHV